MADLTIDRPDASAGDRESPTEPSGPADLLPPSPGPVDPRAVRVGIAPASRVGEAPPLIVGPLPVPLAPTPRSLAGKGPLGGATPDTADPDPADPATVTSRDGTPAAGPTVIVDGAPASVRLARRGARRALLVVGEGSAAIRHRIVFATDAAPGPDGLARRELAVDGWHIEVELEPERRAALRERARRGREASAHGGPTEVRAIIPGRVVAVSVVPGDSIEAGQQILVVEAMKMQNELRAPRDGTIRQIAVAVGETIEVGDLLLVIE